MMRYRLSLLKMSQPLPGRDGDLFELIEWSTETAKDSKMFSLLGAWRPGMKGAIISSVVTLLKLEQMENPFGVMVSRHVAILP